MALICGVLCIIMGIQCLITPYEKMKEKNPKFRIKSPTGMKVFGIFLIVCGALISLLLIAYGMI